MTYAEEKDVIVLEVKTEDPCVWPQTVRMLREDARGYAVFASQALIRFITSF